ncbi:MAG: GTP 3',8-cyclase MoaA [Pelagibacteraceae bacterium]|jgi:cyclic pyranopterin phosphate synthase|nr:GTP 3',8-cyclase MoaA [Pelagibacteraceae bacterium]MDC0426020.1 GTP 3',8-cyclase MoaA [Pelagibacteraceae bacterium]
MSKMSDSFGRSFPYIRLSITDVCNFKCGYCLPNGYFKVENKPGFLNLDEISNLVAAFTELGVSKIRITGGEPTVRKDFFEVLKNIKSEHEISNLVITTNGYKLNEIAEELIATRINGINISIDSLDRNKFKEITGQDRLPQILEGINILQNKGFKNIKVNAVLLKNVNDSLEEFQNWERFINNNEIDFRYIELMQTGDNLEYFKKYHTSAFVFKKYIESQDWKEISRISDAGPSINYVHSKLKGKFGIIAPYSKDFCSTCNRLRITAKGELRLCLFGNTGTNLRPYLQNQNQKDELIELILKQLRFKKESHYLETGNTGMTPHLASIGG